MTKRIKQHLMQNNSYFKWGVTRLATKFGCSEKTMKNILNDLKPQRTIYLRNLNG